MRLFYLPGLNGIRAIAALIVLFSHIWQFQYWFGFSEPAYVPYDAAGLGVTLFFVLSGYLITYLLILEKEKSRTVALGKFYIRRILRIWPLYYLILSISIFVVDIGDTSCTMLCFFLMPNVAVALACIPSVIVPLWSIGVEEQFYLGWPILVKYSKKILPSLIGVIVVYLLIKLIFRFVGSEALNTFIGLTRVDSMAIGGLGAWWANSNRVGHHFIFNKATQITSWIIFFVGCSGGMFYLPAFIEQEVYSSIFILIILNVSLNPKPIVSLENRIFDWMGKISYGIYLSHLLILYLLSAIIQDKLTSLPFGLLFYFVVSVVLVLTVAYLSYTYFERFFIRVKKKFMVVRSANSKLGYPEKN